MDTEERMYIKKSYNNYVFISVNGKALIPDTNHVPHFTRVVRLKMVQEQRVIVLWCAHPWTTMTINYKK